MNKKTIYKKVKRKTGGYVKISKLKNGNTKLKIYLPRLDLSRLLPELTAKSTSWDVKYYERSVAWEDFVKKVNAKVGAGMYSKDSIGTLGLPNTNEFNYAFLRIVGIDKKPVEIIFKEIITIDECQKFINNFMEILKEINGLINSEFVIKMRVDYEQN